MSARKSYAAFLHYIFCVFHAVIISFLSQKPSFFEITTALAFSYFAEREVDIAVIETGLGGRLDCTNIIKPILSVITNIGFDHTALLGSTLEQIATEKAGIIKPKTPVVIGEYTPETKGVFETKANETGSQIIYAQDNNLILSEENRSIDCVYYKTKDLYIKSELAGYCQNKNAKYYFTQASVERSATAAEIQKIGLSLGLHGNTYNTVPQAIAAARAEASPNDFIFVGGSTFVVADLLSMVEFYIQG